MINFIPVNDEKNGCPFVQMTSFEEIEKAEEENDVDFREVVYGVKSAEVIAEDGVFTVKVYSDQSYEGVTIRPFYVKTNMSDGTLWEEQIALYFRWTCLPDCAVPELDADYRRNNRRLS